VSISQSFRSFSNLNIKNGISPFLCVEGTKQVYKGERGINFKDRYFQPLNKYIILAPTVKTLSKSAHIAICLYSCGDWAR